MDRTDVHQQIRELSDKINHLNENLFNSRKIHPVEIDLIKLYARELNGMIDQLSILAGAAPKEEVGSWKLEAGKGKSGDNTKQTPITEKEIAPVPPPTVQKEAPPAPEVKSGFSINISDDEPAVKEPETVTEPATEKIEFLAEEQQTSPPPRRQVTIQPPQQSNQVQQHAPQQEPPAPTRREPEQQEKERTKPVIQLSMEAEDAEAPSINDLFAQHDHTEHYNKAKRADTKGFKESMDLGERFLFLKELFDGNQSAFDNATEKLSNLDSFEEAKTFVEGTLRTQFTWVGKDNVVKQFYTLLEHRFRK